MSVSTLTGTSPTRFGGSGGAALQINNVSKVFGRGVEQTVALQDVTLQVARGEFLTIVGASGCGKSTLLNLVARLDQPTLGQIVVDGKVALMFQEATLLPWLTAQQNIELALKLAGTPKAERTDRAESLLELVRLEGAAGKRPHELSGGMKQRVALARVLAQDAPIVLMDEPFGALDAMTRDRMHDELERIWTELGLTVVFVTHNMREAVRLGDRVVLLTSRPGQVKSIRPIDLPRPRRMDSAEVAGHAAALTDALSRGGGSACRLTSSPPSSTSRRRPRHESPLVAKVWGWVWPKALAIGLVIFGWQLVVWSGWKPVYTLPGPAAVLRVPLGLHADAGLLAGRRHHLAARAVRLHGRGHRRDGGRGRRGARAGAAPRGRLADHRAADHAVHRVVPARDPALRPQRDRDLLRGDPRSGTQRRQRRHQRDRQHPAAVPPPGQGAGARGVNLYRHIVLPAALPAYLAGMTQGWAFSWRSLMAGELLVIIPGRFALGSQMEFARNVNDATKLLALMIVILVVGMLADGVFSSFAGRVRRRRGLGLDA